MNSVKKTRDGLFGSGKFYKNALSIAVPIMLQQLIQSMVSLVDNFMVSGLGDVAMSGVNVAGQIIFVFMVYVNTICMAGGIFMTQYFGADDKNGVWILLKCLSKFQNLKVAFFVGEEVGCIGSSKADMDFFKDVRFVIQCDRRGSSDLIASICSTEIASKEFIEATGHEAFSYHLEEGMMTDVLTLKENGLQVSAVNMSCGYYDPHSDHEFTVKRDLLNCLSFVEHIIENCTGTYQHQCDYSMGFFDDIFYDEYYDEIYELLQTYPDVTFGEIEAAYQQHNPRLDHSELKQTYEMVKNDLDFWRKEEEYYAKHY